jgi:sugar phosphate isomerase/epimerase
MELRVYKSLWGMSGSVGDQFRQIAEAGYNGVESACEEIADAGEFRDLLAKYELDYIPLIYTEGDHYASFERLVELAAGYSPTKIVAHAGRDNMSFNEQVKFFEFALKVEGDLGIPIAHETHRRRPLFSPMNALALMKELPDLKLNIDLSHWCCVTESMLVDHEEAVQLALERAIHLHARVGYENGPQVPDPRVREWEAHQGRFEVWWKKYVIEQRGRRGVICSVTPEYGPPSYMHTIPSTGLPAADLWEVCLWSATRFREMYGTILQ